MEEDKKEGRCRIMYRQLNNASTNMVHNGKIDRAHNLNEKYQVDVNLFAEVGVNWTAGADNNFASWFSQDLKKIKCVTACNE